MTGPRRARPMGLLAALGLGGCIAAASASQADAFDPASQAGPMGRPRFDGSMPPEVQVCQVQKPILILHGDRAQGAGGSYGLPAPRTRRLTDAMLDLASDDASGRAFRYPVDDFPMVFNPPPPAVFAGGNAPGAPSLDAVLDHLDDRAAARAVVDPDGNVRTGPFQLRVSEDIYRIHSGQAGLPGAASATTPAVEAVLDLTRE